MKRSIISGLAAFFVVLFSLTVRGAQSINEAELLRRAEKALTDVMVHDIFSPPVASRIYLYANVAAYESLVKFYPDYTSLHSLIKNFPDIPAPRQTINASLASVYAFLLVGQKLVFSEPILEDSMRNILGAFKSKTMTTDLYKASLGYGRQVADSIIAWSDKDQYKETRTLSRYRLTRGEGKWIPTPPAYMAAIEPYWSKIRPISLNTGDQFRPAAAPAFSKDTNSLFYRQAYDVYTAVNQLTDTQKDIANFWDCNPFAVNVEGHLGFAAKKISPGGHWINIVGTVSRQQQKKIMETAAAYTITSIAMFDAFISCWDEKYRSNVIRPETYIDANIDETWRPLLQTPPFPEYTSGHSIISTVSALVLTRYFGEQCSFDDDTEVEFGLPSRHFDSFGQAAAEAAISRFYGGIHYRAAIEAGQVSGKAIGEWVLSRIRLEKGK